jgi:hypothetical protein
MSDDKQNDIDKSKLTGRARSLANLNPPIKKGQKLKTPGRPKGVQTFQVVFRKFYRMTPKQIEKATGIKIKTDLKGKTVQDIMAAKAIADVLNGDTRMFVEMMNRTDGMSNQMIDLVSHDADLVALESLPPELRIEILNEMIEEAKAEMENPTP